MKREVQLCGGRTTAGVVRVGDTVRRPQHGNSTMVHRLLIYLAEHGFDGAPRVMGHDDQGRTILSYIDGVVPPELGFHNDDVLAAAARLIRRYHDATEAFGGGSAIVCHNDLSPCNFVFVDGLPVALIDFDAAAPGTRTWDLSYAAWLWLDIGNSDYPCAEQRRRLAVFAGAYDPALQVEELIAAMLERQQLLAAEPGSAERQAWAADCRQWTPTISPLEVDVASTCTTAAMDQPLDIRDVARRTGLTSRALRFYEARGLLKPLRTYSGRRIYGRGELERIQHILALKRAGLSLAQIGKLTARGNLDLAALVEAQLRIIEERKAELDEAKSLLLSIKSRIDRGEPVDAATFCSLIREGDRIMQPEDWKKVTDRFFSKEEQAHWAEHPPQGGFDQAEYSRKWKDLGDRVQAAIPLGPHSPEAQALYDEWQALLAPFTAVATPQMMAGATRFYERMDEWKGDVPNAPFTPEAFRFIQEIGRIRKGPA